MHFLINVDFEEFNEEMIQYFNDNLDDEILVEALPRVSLILKKQAKIMQGQKKGQKIKGKITECQFNGDGRTGIISLLNRLSGGNALNNGFLVMKDGVGSNNSTFSKLLTPDDGCYNLNANSYDKAWIEFDFGQRKVNVSSYSFLTCCANYGPKSWRILGSNDRSNWTVLNNQVNRGETKAQQVIAKFDCDKNDDYYQFIRFTQEETWNTSNGCRYYMHFKYIEFFGSVLEPE